MGLGDKAKHAAEEAGGKLKEGAGKLTDNERLEAEGQGDQAKANVKQAGDDVRTRSTAEMLHRSTTRAPLRRGPRGVSGTVRSRRSGRNAQGRTARAGWVRTRRAAGRPPAPPARAPGRRAGR